MSSQPDEIGKVVNGGPADYRVYLVNENNHDIANVEMYTGGYEGTGETGEIASEEEAGAAIGQALAEQRMTWFFTSTADE
jgi:hypothetical protein